VTRGDLERCRASLAEPLSVALEAGTVFNTPPPTQVSPRLIILALFERLRVPEARGFDHVHGLIEATKRAFAVRDRVVTDPDRIQQPVDRYLDAGFSMAKRARSIAARPRTGRAPMVKATRCGWAPPTPPGSSSPTSSRSIGNSARASYCPRPAYSCKIAAPAFRSNRAR
jgi:gamma-glutamyltranspeptidase